MELHFIQFYSEDTQQWIKAAPKLFPIHIEPNIFSNEIRGTRSTSYKTTVTKKKSLKKKGSPIKEQLLKIIKKLK